MGRKGQINDGELSRAPAAADVVDDLSWGSEGAAQIASHRLLQSWPILCAGMRFRVIHL
jgi:hypothetical protein